MWERVRRPVGVVVAICGVAAMGFGLREDAGADIGRFVSGAIENWPVSIAFLVAVGFAGFAWWPSVRRALFGINDEELRQEVRYWLDDRMNYTIQSIPHTSDTNSFQIDAELYARNADGSRGERVYALTVAKPRDEPWLNLGLNTSSDGPALEALTRLSVDERDSRVRDAVVQLAQAGTRSNGVGRLVDEPATGVDLTERVYLDQPLTESRFMEAVQKLRFSYLVFAYTISVRSDHLLDNDVAASGGGD